MQVNKIFGIGLPKTGTKSLAYAFRSIGYSADHYLGEKRVIKKIKQRDFLNDMPITTRYKFYDKIFKNSKFILTVRELHSWLSSCKNHFRREKHKHVGRLRQELFGDNKWNRELFLHLYKEHFREVYNYFKNRKNDLLIIDIVGGDGYKKISEFLDIKIHKNTFPHKNKRSYKNKHTSYNSIFMKNKEIQTIRKYLDRDDIMLEWGSGGSTWYFPLFVKEYHSIEHQEKWYKKVSNNILHNTTLYLQEANKKTNRCKNRSEYKDYIEKVHDLNIKKFDKVLIDGRGRKYCAKEVLPYLQDDSLVFIHDFWNRKRYHSVLKYYDVVEKITSGKQLAVLRKK